MWIKFSAKQMINNSVHIGHDIRITLVANSWFFKGKRQYIFIIDIMFTIWLFRWVINLYTRILYKRGNILFVNNLNVMADLIELWAKKSAQPFSNLKWYVGTLTNIKSLIGLFELMKFEKRKEKKYIHNTYGLMKMKRIPNALFLSSLGTSTKAKWEAMYLKLPCVGIIDTNVSSFGITLPLPGNDQSIDSLNYFYSCINKIITIGKFSSLLKYTNVIWKKDYTLEHRLFEDNLDWWKARWRKDLIKMHDWRKFKYKIREKKKVDWARNIKIKEGLYNDYVKRLNKEMEKKIIRRVWDWKMINFMFQRRFKRLQMWKRLRKAHWKMTDLWDKRFSFKNNFTTGYKTTIEELYKYKMFTEMIGNSLRRYREYFLGSKKKRQFLFNTYLKFFIRFQNKMIENKNIYRKHNRIAIYKYNEVSFKDVAV